MNKKFISLALAATMLAGCGGGAASTSTGGGDTGGGDTQRSPSYDIIPSQ